MSAISLRLPESLHAAARKLAAKEKVSLNQLITLALAEKISALMTVDYLAERGRRGKPKRLLKLLEKVADVEPEEYDRI